MRIEFSQGFDKARFARTTGGGYNEQVSGVIHGNKSKTVRWARKVRGSLDILHLLAQLLDQHLHVNRDAGQLQGG